MSNIQYFNEIKSLFVVIVGRERGRGLNGSILVFWKFRQVFITVMLNVDRFENMLQTNFYKQHKTTYKSNYLSELGCHIKNVLF